jgi:nucleoid-associated protein YgaU
MMTKKGWTLLLLLVLSGLIAFAGDVRAQEGMSREEVERMIAEYRAREAEARQMIEEQEMLLEECEAELMPLEKKVADLMDEVDEIEAEIAKYETAHTVVPGEYLAKIAGYRYVYNSEARWPRIYRANRDQIEDPNLIYPKQVFMIPRGMPHTHVVNQDEWLAKIAGYWEIYNDHRKWPKIYEANRDQIKDADLIHPGQILDIPRD